MHVKKAIKQLLSLTLSFCLIITCVSSALATGVIHSKYDNNFTGSAALSAEINGDTNLLLGDSYVNTTDLTVLKAGEYTITASAYEEGERLFLMNPATSGKLANSHITDGELVYNSAKVADIYAGTSNEAYRDYLGSNNRVVFMDADGGWHDNLYYDITFRLDKFSDLDKLIYVNSTGTNTLYTKLYDIYVSDTVADLYESYNLKYACVNDVTSSDFGIVQEINFDDGVQGEYIGVRIRQGVQDNCASRDISFVRCFEIAAIGSPLYSLTTSKPSKSNDVKIADTTADGKTIDDSIIFGASPSPAGMINGAGATVCNSTHLTRLANATDGYYNNTSATNCDLTIDAFSYKDTDGTYKFYNGYDPATVTYDKNNLQSYVTFTYDLGSEYTLNEFWIYGESSSNGVNSLGIYELYASTNASNLYDSSNRVGVYHNTKISWCQKFCWDKPLTATHFGIKFIMGITGSDFTRYSRVRVLEAALFGTSTADYAVTYKTPSKSNDVQIADLTKSGKGIADNLIYGKIPAVAGIKNGEIANMVTTNIHRTTDGYYNNTATASCDLSGVAFVDYDAATDTYTQANGYNHLTGEYDENNIDTFVTLTYQLGGKYKLTDFWFYSENETGDTQNLQTGLYEVYTADKMTELYNPENKIFTHNNTNSTYCQQVRFFKEYSGKYLGIKIIEGVTFMENSNYKYSRCRLPEIAVFGDKVEDTTTTTYATSVDFTNTVITDEFFGGKQKQSLLVSMEHGLKQLEGSMKNFDNAAKVIADGDLSDYQDYTFFSNFAADSDVYKFMEGMAYAYANYKDSTDPEEAAMAAKIPEYFNDMIPRILAAKGEDHYLNTYFTISSSDTTITPDARFQKRPMHELYCYGHLFEAAVAIYKHCGDDRLLTASADILDMLYSVFYLKNHPTYTATFTSPGHEEIELALIKMAAVLLDIPEYGEAYAEKCITLSQYYLDENRKQQGNALKGEDTLVAVSDLTEAWGHCVRAFYLYTAMADMSIYKGDLIYDNLETIWNNVETKTYITGGIGHDQYTEGFADSYDLPNENSYCETCSSISNVFWNKSMNKLYDDAKYFDNIEKQLYNNVISGLGLDGQHYYYQNRLTNAGGVARPEWYGTPCCPTNMIRLLQSLGGYIYTTKDDLLTVNLYIGNESSFDFMGKNMQISMTSDMPWNGNVSLTINPEAAETFTLRLRLPYWAKGNNTLTINGEVYSTNAGSNGYISITRQWNKGDVIALSFPQEVEVVDNSDVITTNKGLVAVTRGPIVYAIEQIDNEISIDNLCITEGTTFSVETVTDFVSGQEAYGTGKLNLLKVMGQTAADFNAGKSTRTEFTMIPFYAWANRGKTPMKVYMATGEIDIDPDAPLLDHTTLSASFTYANDNILNTVDGVFNKNSRWTSWQGSYGDHVKYPYIDFEFITTATVDTVSVAFYNDGGGVQTPTKVEFEYWNGEEYLPLSHNNPTILDGTNGDYTVFELEPVVTTKLRMKPSNGSRGVGIVEMTIDGSWVFEEKESYTVTFLDKNGGIIGEVTKTEGYVTEEDVTENGIVPPSIFGYEFVGWNAPFEDMCTTMSVMPIYQKSVSDATSCTVSVIGGKANGKTALTLPFDTRFTLTADTVEGKKFSHWTDGAGQVISLDSNVILYSAGDLSFTAVYVGENEEITAEQSLVYINENPCWTTEGDKYTVAFTAVSAVPEGATLLEQGIVIGGKAYNDATDTLTLENCDQKGQAKHVAQNEYMITLWNLGANRHRNVKAYAIYSIDGEAYTAYSSATIHIETTSDTLTTVSVASN